MAKFLTTSAVTYQVEKIIQEAKKKLVLVSPYIKTTKTFLERFKDASERGVQIIIIYGKSELSPSEKKQLDSISTLKLYYFDNLHAKCYFNESEMVITSMNLYEFSEKNNREMGILVTKKFDEEIFNDGVKETHSIIKSAEPIIDNTEPKKELIKNKPKKGFCIRCEKSTKYDFGQPYCYSCFQTWASFGNPFYEENVCHCCGKEEITSMDKPLCYNCYNEFER
jgi:phosphatidylserine/phosphatidylglycerophosphate/cardiolipin synthase-like enzyme